MQYEEHVQPVLVAPLLQVIQLYEMIVVRHGLMLVGYSFGMKTAASRVLVRTSAPWLCCYSRPARQPWLLHP